MPSSKIETVFKLLKDYGVIIAIAIYLIVLSTFITKDMNELYSKKYLYTKDMNELYSKKYLYTLSILIPVLIGFGYLIYSYSVISDRKALGRFAAITVLLFLVIYMYNYFKVSDTIISSASFMSNIIVISIVIFAIMIFAKVFKDIAYSIEGMPGIIMRVLFFIPCMLADFFDLQSLGH